MAFSGKYTISIASGTVAADLSDFVIMVRLSDMPTSFWSKVRSDGGDIRVMTTTNVLVPIDLVRFDYYDHDGVLFFKSSIATATANEWYIYCGDPALSGLADTDINGRFAVWSEYDSVLFFGESRADHTGNLGVGTRHLDAEAEDILAFAKITVTGDLDHHQGVCWGGGYYYLAGTNTLSKYTESWSMVAQNIDPLGDIGIIGINHCGDPEYLDGYIYIPVEVYPADTYTNQHIAVFNAATLEFVTAYNISAQGHEVSSIGYNPVDGLFYVSSFLDGTKLFRYDPSSGFAYDGYLSLSAPLASIQGIVFWHGAIWATVDNHVDVYRHVYRIGLDGTNYGVMFATPSDAATDIEGITKRHDRLLVLADSGTVEKIQTWKAIDMAKGGGGGLYLNGSGEITYAGAPSRTTCTLAVTVAVSNKAANRCALSYWDLSAGVTNTRVSIAYSATNASIGVWDQNNSWLLPSPAINPTLNQSYRVVATYDAAVSRRLYVDGILVNTDTTVTLLPTALDALRVGSEDADNAERFRGKLGFIYLHPAVLSAEWIAAENANISNPQTFYAIADDSPRLLLALLQPWAISSPLMASIEQIYAMKMGADIVQPYSDAPLLRGQLAQPWGNAGVIKAQLVQRWINLIVVRNYLNHHWACLECASTILEQGYQLVEQTVSASLLVNYSLKDTNTITGVLKQAFLVTGNLSTKVLSTQCIVISDTMVFPTSLDIKSSIDQYAITASIELATYEDVRKFIPSTQVEVCGVLNENFILIVDAYDYDLSYDSDTFKVDLISPAALLDSPFADLISGDYTGMASEICKTLAGSIPVTWNIIDWYIGEGILSVSEETPLSVIRKVVNAVGGVVQSLPDGSITVISRYPKSCNAWSVQPPILSINYSEDVISEQFTLENAPGYNSFSIQDDNTSSTLLRVEVEEIDSNSKTIKVFVYPDVEPLVSHSGNTGTVSLNYTGYITENVDEEVEFVSGESSVNGPISGINYSSWKYSDLGSVTYEPTGVLYSTIAGESLMDIIYKTGYYSYTVSTSVLENIQIIVEADI